MALPYCVFSTRNITLDYVSRKEEEKRWVDFSNNMFRVQVCMSEDTYQKFKMFLNDITEEMFIVEAGEERIEKLYYSLDDNLNSFSAYRTVKAGETLATIQVGISEYGSDFSIAMFIDNFKQVKELVYEV